MTNVNQQAITRTVEAYARRQDALAIVLFNRLTKAEQTIAAKRISTKASGSLYNYAGRQISENTQMNRGNGPYAIYQRRNTAGA